MILSFLLNFNLDHDSKSELNKYSEILFKNIPFVDNYKILDEFQNPTSVIHDLVNQEDDGYIFGTQIIGPGGRSIQTAKDI